MRVVIAETAVANVVLGVARHSPDAKTWKGRRKRMEAPSVRKVCGIYHSMSALLFGASSEFLVS